MPGGQARMIQMLAALSEMQQRRRAQDLAEQQFAESQSQFAKQFGFQEKSAEYKKTMDLLDAVARSTTESRKSLLELGNTLGLPADQVSALAHYASAAPETLQAIQMRAATQGQQAMGTDQRAQVNNEAANLAMTGMNQGQLAGSQMQSMLAGGQSTLANQFSPQMIQALVQGAAQRAATGQTPLQAAGDRAVMPQAGQIAQYQYGLQMTPAQQAANALQGQSIANQRFIGEGNIAADYYRTNAQLMSNAAEVNAKLASAKNFGGMTPSDMIQGVNSMRDILQAIGKEKNKEARTMLLGTYNKMASMIDPNMAWNGEGDPPEPAGLLSRFRTGYGTPYMPQQQVPPQNAQYPFAPTPGGQQVPFAPFGQTPYAPNPLTPFIR